MDKGAYLKKYNYIKKRKLFSFLIILFCISILIGILYFFLGSKSNKNMTLDYYTDFFSAIKNSKVNYLECIINSFSSNVLENIVLFLLSISIIGVFFVFLMFIFHSFTLGYVISSFLYFYKLKGIFAVIIYIIPLIIRIFLLFILTFYSFNFANRFYSFLVKKKDIDIKSYFRRYCKVFLFVLILFVFNSLVESVVVPFLLKSFTKSII